MQPIGLGDRSIWQGEPFAGTEVYAETKNTWLIWVKARFTHSLGAKVGVRRIVAVVRAGVLKCCYIRTPSSFESRYNTHFGNKTERHRVASDVPVRLDFSKDAKAFWIHRIVDKTVKLFLSALQLRGRNMMWGLCNIWAAIPWIVCEPGKCELKRLYLIRLTEKWMVSPSLHLAPTCRLIIIFSLWASRVRSGTNRQENKWEYEGERESERKSTRIYEIARECTCVLLEPSFKMTPGGRMGSAAWHAWSVILTQWVFK